MLEGKKILLGITGSIAAYKAAHLTRELKKLGAEVRVILTPSALSFVTPLTLSTLSNNPVLHEFIEDEGSGTWTNHVELGKWADLLLIAPLSANTLSKLVSGECDNLFMATYLSAACPVMVAPAMDLDMADHWTTQENLNKLNEKGVRVLPFGHGELASGLSGKGRMQEPEEIVAFVVDFLIPNGPWKGKRVVVTAGPTHEAIDPVRFIGNHSSGKMGYAITQELVACGANVTLISGPTALKTPIGANRVDVISALEMMDEVAKAFDVCDALIMSAAVADYRPKTIATDKVKKTTKDSWSIELEPNPDILKYCGERKSNQLLVGFALETNNELEHARTKLQNKNLDMLVLNSLKDDGAGFGTDTNKVTFVFPEGEKMGGLKSKQDVAKDILNEAGRLLG